MSARVEVGLLGPVALWLDGEAVPLPGLPQRVLLARLALAAGRVVPVDALVDALWAGDPPGNAIGNLHSYVSRLRRLTGPGPVRRVAAGYRLDLPPAAIDAVRVERLVAEAERQGPAEAAETLGAAVAAWRGEPLSDLADRIAFAPDIARLAEWRRHLGEECLDRRLAAGQAARALPQIEELAAAEPLRERPQLLLMRALHQTGRTAQALEVARAYRERIVEGYGIDPGPALNELRARILAGDAAERPAIVTSPRRPGGSAQRPVTVTAPPTSPSAPATPRGRARTTSWCSSTRCTTWATRRRRCGRRTRRWPRAAWSSPSSRGRWTGWRTPSATRCRG